MLPPPGAFGRIFTHGTKFGMFSPSRGRRLGVVEGCCRSAGEAVQTLPEARGPEVEMYEGWCIGAEYS